MLLQRRDSVRNFSRYLINSLTITRQYYSRILLQNCGEKIFSNIRTDVRVYMKIEMTIVLE